MLLYVANYLGYFNVLTCAQNVSEEDAQQVDGGPVERNGVHQVSGAK